MEKISIGEAVAWIGLFLLIVWIILKLFGVIQTPLILETAPIIMLALILGGLLSEIKNLKYEVRRDIKDVKSEMKNIGNSLVRLGQDFKQLKGEHDVFKSKKH